MMGRLPSVGWVAVACAAAAASVATWRSACEAAAAESPSTVLVEAESFADYGGWVLDSQFIDQMGSSFLMAHGLGEPVADATTTVELPAAGAYRVLVRTRDWAAPWRKPGQPWEPPGKFQLLVNGKPLPVVFGTEGADWHWQDGGRVELAGATSGGSPKATLALKDLTGFNGRVDAILLTTDAELKPPDSGPALAELRRSLLRLPEKPDEAGPFDLVVVGGGIAGTCAAVSAARLGLSVALIQDRPVLGGNNSSEIRVHLGGGIHLPPYPALGGVVRELGPREGGNAGPPERYEDEKKLAVVRAEPNIRLMLNTRVVCAETIEPAPGVRHITAVVGQDVRTGRQTRFTGRLFADCTGDANLGYLAGADYRYGRESRAETGEPLAPETPDRMVMGTSIQWRSKAVDAPSPFPDCPWAVEFNEPTCQRAAGGEWNWETGFQLDQVADAERIRDHGLRAVFGNWAYQKNHCADKARWANVKLEWVAHVGGKRESRRLLGDVILRQQDVTERREFPDASVTTTWTIDLHYPIQSEQFPGEEFRSRAEHVKIEPYAIPYRCLYSRNVENLFMAGRNVSVTHVALGTVRVMRTCGMMGEVVGMAAEICKRRDATPRMVYANYLDELKAHMQRGVGKLGAPATVKPPDWLRAAGPNLARAARVSVSGEHPSGLYPAKNVNDGRVSYSDNAQRRVSDARLPGVVELAWDSPQTVGAVRIVSGQAGGDEGPKTPIEDFILEYDDGQGYRPIRGARITGNQAVDWHARFVPVRATRLRLSVSKTPGDLTRLWELEVYGPVGE